MTEWAGKRYWMVGASEGLGRALAHKLSRAGVYLILSARSRDRLESLSEDLPGPSEIVTCDVTDDADVARAAEDVGEIDGLIYLAGVYWPLSAQDWNAEQVTTMFDVNLTGAARVLGQVVPGMVKRDAGHIVMTGSLSGYRGLPGATGYTAAKAGVMVMAEALYADLRNTGIKVQLVNPGFIRTRLTEKNDFRMPQLMEPEDAAATVFDHMNSERFQRSFPAPFAWAFRLGQFLPDPIYYRLFA